MFSLTGVSRHDNVASIWPTHVCHKILFVWFGVTLKLSCSTNTFFVHDHLHENETPCLLYYKYIYINNYCNICNQFQPACLVRF